MRHSHETFGLFSSFLSFTLWKALVNGAFNPHPDWHEPRPDRVKRASVSPSLAHLFEFTTVASRSLALCAWKQQNVKMFPASLQVPPCSCSQENPRGCRWLTDHLMRQHQSPETSLPVFLVTCECNCDMSLLCFILTQHSLMNLHIHLHFEVILLGLKSNLAHSLQASPFKLAHHCVSALNYTSLVFSQ